MIPSVPTKTNRGETPEERQWKQMQAYRQQQAQQQQLVLQEHRLHGDPKQEMNVASGGLVSSKHQYSPGIEFAD